MPKRNEQSYMIVKTQRGDVKVDKNGNRFPVSRNNNREEVVDEELLDMLGEIGALAGEAKDSYEKRKKRVRRCLRT